MLIFLTVAILIVSRGTTSPSNNLRQVDVLVSVPIATPEEQLNLQHGGFVDFWGTVVSCSQPRTLIICKVQKGDVLIVYYDRPVNLSAGDRIHVVGSVYNYDGEIGILGDLKQIR